MGQMQINELENYTMSQVDYQIMWHIILKLNIQISFENVVGTPYVRLIVYWAVIKVVITALWFEPKT